MTTSDEDLEAARELVLAHGAHATAYQILNPGIRHWFSRDREAVAGYVEYGGYRIVAGAPVCADERLDAVLSELQGDARSHGRRLCWFGAEAALADRLVGQGGHSRFRLGAQPVWTPSRWEDAVRGHASMRAQLHRARNKGVAVREWPAGRHDREASLQRCLDEWLRSRGAPPMHFLVEPQTLGRLFDRRLFVAERAAQVVGFLVASPVPRRSGWLVEQIIRGRGAVNGTSELLVDTAMRALAADGSDYVTLGLSPLSTRANVERVPTPLWLRFVAGWVRAHARRFYNFDGLDAFKAKLRPERWETLDAVADSPRFPPSALHAIAGAFTVGSPAIATLAALAWAVRQEWNGVRRRPASALRQATGRRRR